MRVFLQSVYGQVILGGMICWWAWRWLPKGGWGRKALLGVFALEWGVFFTGFFFHDVLPDAVMIPIMLVCNTWYLALIYYAAVPILLLPLRFAPERWRGTLRAGLATVAMVGIALLLVAGYDKVSHPVVRHVRLTIPKHVPERDSLTIVLMSDLHIGEIVGKEWVRRYVELSNAQCPDIVVLAGDLIDYEVRFAEAMHAEDDLRRLHAPLGVYLVYGNHEYRANYIAKQRWLHTVGATVLVDSVASPDSLLYLVGRDDYINPQRATLASLMRLPDRSKPLIVLDHQPNTLNESAMNGADLCLHGHTHNGQIWPAPLLLRLVYDCPYGYCRKGATQYVVSSGIGIAGQPYRIGTRSELVVLHLHFLPS
ncbi:MAG: metallophosphoesterase [Tannerellaceae bacterium]|jgi:predicted MPP superfamily phosphohydrolase|nr:metallophosphoesterase [Tannerellaceae bacterium]